MSSSPLFFVLFSDDIFVPDVGEEVYHVDGIGT